MVQIVDHPLWFVDGSMLKLILAQLILEQPIEILPQLRRSAG
jgi:hypothetical protein